MGQMLVRNIEDDLLLRLKSKAKAQGLSLAEFARRTLEEAAGPSRDELWAEVDRIRALTPKPLESSAWLIREDRDNDESYR